MREIFQLHEPQHVGDARGDLAPWQPFLLQTESDVLFDAHMREERVGLEHHVHRPQIRRQLREVRAVQRDAPALGVSKPAIIRMSVVLPQPDGPSRQKNSPS